MMEMRNIIVLKTLITPLKQFGGIEVETLYCSLFVFLYFIMSVRIFVAVIRNPCILLVYLQ